MKETSRIMCLFLTVMVAHATCPTPTLIHSWSYGTSVQYHFPANFPPPCWAGESITALGIDGDIHAAFNQWNFANQSQNGSNVGFYHSGSGPFLVLAQTVVDPSACGVSNPAQTYIAHFAGTQTVAYVQTFFYFGSTSTFGYSNWDPSAGNFHTAVQKMMVHEIGHSMGLDNQPIGGGTCGGQTAGESVMNAQCGTNDSQNNQPAPMFGIPSCDNQSI